LIPVLGHQQHWRLLDHDRKLLKLMREHTRRWAVARALSVNDSPRVLRLRGEGLACTLQSTRCDIAGVPDSLPLADVDVVTASALLDLVSHEWLQQMVAHCVRHAVTVLFALTYDGRICFTPAHADDETVRLAVNKHQRFDKGFGPALGPAATTTARLMFEANGYAVQTADSTWWLGRDDDKLQARLVTDWSAVACEMDDTLASNLAAWRNRRLALVQQRRSRLLVGHIDLLASPAT
jgi:hypothetical protein